MLVEELAWSKSMNKNHENLQPPFVQPVRRAWKCFGNPFSHLIFDSSHRNFSPYSTYWYNVRNCWAVYYYDGFTWGWNAWVYGIKDACVLLQRLPRHNGIKSTHSCWRYQVAINSRTSAPLLYFWRHLSKFNQIATMAPPPEKHASNTLAPPPSRHSIWIISFANLFVKT